jgi:Flp pilus assembly pilin Flp
LDTSESGFADCNALNNRNNNSKARMHSMWGLSEGFMRFLHEEDGVSFIECALVASLIAVVAAIGFLALGKGRFG